MLPFTLACWRGFTLVVGLVGASGHLGAQSTPSPIASSKVGAAKMVLEKPSMHAAPVQGPADELLMHERQLAAIRDALLQTTLQSPLRVRSTAWIDAEGRLHESAQFTAQTQVRGVRVESYLTHDHQPGYRVQVDAMRSPFDTQLAGQPGAVDDDTMACSERHARWRQRVQVKLRWSDGWSDLPLSLAKHLQIQTQGLWSQDPSSDRWLWQASPSSFASVYAQHLLQPLPPPSADARAELTVAVVQPASAPPPKPVLPWVSQKSVTPEAFLHWRLKIHMPTTEQERSFEWKMPLVYGPVSMHGKPSAGRFMGWNLPSNALQELQQWMNQIDHQTRCDVVAFRVQRVGQEWRVMAQGEHGARPGDRFLIVDRAALPQRLLDPDALASVALAEIALIGRESSGIKWLAGPIPQEGQDWVALPL